jgi:hypothetical protein
MKKISTLLLSVISLTAFAQTYTTGTVTLSSTAGAAMSIKLDVGASVTMTLTGPSARWFAVGFDAGSMAVGTDVVAVHSAGALTSFDGNLTGYSAPASDVQQDWTISSNVVAGGVRTVIATRVLNTGDPNDHVFTAALGSISLIWARANSNTFSYAHHGNTNRGLSSATFTLVPVTPPPTGNSPQTVCAGATLNQLQVTGSSIQWYANASGGIALSNATPLVNGATYYASQTVSGQESQTRLAVTVNVISAPVNAPQTVNFPQNVCSNQNTIALNASNVQGATGYQWTINGVNSTTQQPALTITPQAGIALINIQVAATNVCGNGPSSTAQVQVLPAYNVNQTLSACDFLSWNGQVLTQSGNYSFQGQTLSGCDSVVTLQLTILSNTQTNLQFSQCVPLTLNGQTYNQSGTYQQILPSNLGCDSTLNIQFTLNQGDTVLVGLSSCDSVSIGGQTYTNSGIIPELLTNVNGCDSLVLWDVVINQSAPLSVFDTTVTSSFLWNGQEYTSSGSYTQQLNTIQGCDSVVTVNLTVSTGGLAENEFKSPFPTVLPRGGELMLPYGNWILVDMNGRELWKGTLADTRLRMDVVPGIYFIRSERKAVKIIIIE